ncbi:hypothetical protein AVEN_189328-1 [Araneus ventricosus]|uniref:Uncharacterized protein n=1 Tax=Araneus ventricosus TaxID=182803 RepID=A0A4Y2GHD8_ARAVE|nr:hypothetical protein AVEN_189328-1 [Araneus ventricosus]
MRAFLLLTSRSNDLNQIVHKNWKTDGLLQDAQQATNCLLRSGWLLEAVIVFPQIKTKCGPVFAKSPAGSKYTHHILEISQTSISGITCVLLSRLC